MRCNQRKNKQGWGHKIGPGMTLKTQTAMTLAGGGPRIWLQASWSVTEFTMTKDKNKPVAYVKH